MGGLGERLTGSTTPPPPHSSSLRWPGGIGYYYMGAEKKLLRYDDPDPDMAKLNEVYGTPSRCSALCALPVLTLSCVPPSAPCRTPRLSHRLWGMGDRPRK